MLASIVMRYLLYSRRAEKPAERQEEEAVIEILREQGGTMSDSVSRPCCDGRSNHCNSEGSNTLRLGTASPALEHLAAPKKRQRALETPCFASTLQAEGKS